MPSPLQLRRAGVVDAALVAALHTRSWLATYRGLLPDTFLDHEAADERATHWDVRMPEIDAGAGDVIIAEHAGVAVGFLCVVAPDDDGLVYVDNLHAVPTFKGQGVGSTLLAYAERWAKERAARGMYLLVLDGNTGAEGFYVSRGWTRVGSKSDTMGGVAIVAHRYDLVFAGP